MELIVSITVVLILVIIGFNAVGVILENARATQCLSNLRTLGGATQLYLTDNDGKLPIALEMATGPGGQSGWNSETVGAWYWNLAPYVDVPRWDSSKQLLGDQGGRVQHAVVFTCPGHASDEPVPITFPSTRPVSYAPSSQMRTTDVRDITDNSEIFRLSINDIKEPSRKVWLSDSTHPNILNVSVARWRLQDQTGWPRIAFNRHRGAGNVLFFDGRVERIPYESILEGGLSETVHELFHPLH